VIKSAAMTGLQEVKFLCDLLGYFSGLAAVRSGCFNIGCDNISLGI